MDTKSCYYKTLALVLLFVPVVIYSQGPCPYTYRCRGGYRCAMVRHGHGPPVPDCITIEEALMLKRALRGGATGPGTGIRTSRRYPVYPPRRWRDPRVVHHPGPGILPVGGVNVGVPGVIPLAGGGHIHVPTPNSVRDESERINLNLTIHNENNNKHDQRGSGNVRVTQVTGSGCNECGPEGLCPPGQYCMWDSACPNNLGCRVLP